MASYVGLLRQDIFYHKSCEDASSWPCFVSQFSRSLQNELKLPRWLESVPYNNERVLDPLRVSDDASHNDWVDTKRIITDGVQQCLHAMQYTALADCARIRAVCKAERVAGIKFPKQSFLAVLVRNAIWNADPGLCLLDNVPVILPRHFSGEAIPILKYMTKSLLAPLVISICEQMPVTEDDSDPDHRHELSDDENDRPESFDYCPVTASESLCRRNRTVIHEEEESEEKVSLEAYFLACPLSTAPPSVCHIPVLCMGDEDQLPVMMSSFLYQRRVWRINDPLIGVEFSKYGTMIRFYLGWLEDGTSSDRVLPRVHLAEIGTPVALDLSSPQIALAVSRAFCGLEPHISGVRDTIRQFSGTVANTTRSHSPLSWRIDADIPQQDLGSNLSRDLAICQWAESQRHLGYRETMPPRKKVEKISLPGSEASTQASRKPTSVKTSNATSSPIPSAEGSLSIPKIREPHGQADGGSTLRSFSCSAFAATSEVDEYRVFRWMFDRQVVPQSIPSDLVFREKYKAMTGFIWPETWHVRKDLPPVDAALEPFVQELIESVDALEAQPNGVKRIPVEVFPVDLRILEQSFSAIFQASRRSREKTKLQENVYEASWRVDHDRLLFDFFVRLSRTSEGGAVRALTNESVVYLEDQLARPTLETTLRLPRSHLVKQNIRENLEDSFEELLLRRSPDLRKWVLDHGGDRSQSLDEVEHSGYVVSQWKAWRKAVERETETSTNFVHGRLPSTGRCDALGRLLVKLPDMASSDITKFQLVVRTAGKPSHPGEAFKDKTSVKRTDFIGDDETTKTSGATRYNIPSFSISSSSPRLDREHTTSTALNALASGVQKLNIGTNNAYLELPILTVEYKKASDNSVKGTNQSRMYLTAAVKFLEAVGITNVPVYGMLTDSPIAVFPAAILRDDGFVYMFERLVERIDISTALGAWHYATILCRLVHDHAKLLEAKFEEVKEDLVARLWHESKQGGKSWTLEQQLAELTRENKEK